MYKINLKKQIIMASISSLIALILALLTIPFISNASGLLQFAAAMKEDGIYASIIKTFADETSLYSTGQTLRVFGIMFLIVFIFIIISGIAQAYLAIKNVCVNITEDFVEYTGMLGKKTKLNLNQIANIECKKMDLILITGTNNTKIKIATKGFQNPLKLKSSLMDLKK
ncbi:hypothetical protein [Mycoplasma phocoenae]|uniref:Uncharacterized protein n=1 Tax=Mycoplasma phocoenae TaxID=754517 RepID=A0A858U6T0_9MOLU|nr:hypothetical protein [Mycoplasma phocoenae]QJG66975.1 hypothetical protein HGG69_01395 [Mycoplasma phocoenae]